MPTPVISIFEVADYREELAEAARLLRDGRIVVLPTETVYGAAALLTSPKAMAKLQAIRGEGDLPFTIHLAHRDDARHYLGPVSELAKRMMTKLWPGPVAIEFAVPETRCKEVAKKLGVEPSALYRSGAITLRCPDHIVTNDVLSEIEGPVVITRAGSEPATIAKELDGKADLIIDAGPSRYSKASTIVRVKDDAYEIVREGVYDARIIERLMRTTILFVCSGNTCRSPMAEALARRVIADRLKVSEDELEAKGIAVISAGSFAMPGARATPAAVEAVKSMGADLSKHRSKPLSVELIHQADAIYTMGKSHAQAVVGLVPGAREKTHMLDPDKDVEDPIGGDLSLYQELAGDLKVLIEKRLAESGLI